MASTRSIAQTRPTARIPSGDAPGQALLTLARHGARVQIAACAAAAKTLTEWAQTNDRLVQAVGDELLRRVDGETNSGELIVQVASATNVHLRELAALPGAAADRFATRLSRASIDN